VKGGDKYMLDFLFNNVTDPVCKMGVNKNQSKFSAEHNGKVYYFCSENCLKTFNAEPGKYVAQPENTASKTCCH